MSVTQYPVNAISSIFMVLGWFVPGHKIAQGCDNVMSADLKIVRKQTGCRERDAGRGTLSHRAHGARTQSSRSSRGTEKRLKRGRGRFAASAPPRFRGLVLFGDLSRPRFSDVAPLLSSNVYGVCIFVYRAKIAAKRKSRLKPLKRPVTSHKSENESIFTRLVFSGE